MKISRISQEPSLYVPKHGDEKKPAWLELFYDLIYVAAIIQLGNGLSNHVGFVGMLEFAVLFYFLWYTWANFSFFYNRFTTDDAIQRLLVFAQMFAIGGMAVSVGQIFEGKHHVFIGCYTFARLMIVAMYLRVWRTRSLGHDAGKIYSLIWGASSVIWGLSLLLPSPWLYLAWAVATIVDFTAPLTPQARDLNGKYPSDGGHITERFGLLTIIVLGEMFVKVLSEVSGAQATPSHLLMAGLGLLITCSLWWLYFDDVAESRIKRSPTASLVWLYAHFPLTMSITAVGVAIKKTVFFDPNEVAYLKYRVLLCGVLCLALVSMAVIDMVTERTHAQMRDASRVRMRWVGAGTVASMIFLGGFMPAWMFMALVAAACVGQVAADLMLAPEALAEKEHASAISFGSKEKDAEEEEREAESEKKRFSFENAVRLGVPDAFRNDLYFQLMEGTWSQLFLAVAAAYLFINLVFAGLFLVEPGCISGIEQATFTEAFAFSVQTFTTIGYGSMSPVGAYADALVTIEALLGILWVALVTGLVFAKAARPKASIMFSKHVVITRRHGKRTLMMRLGNARGNAVVSAEIRLSALIDEVSPEGHSMRVLHDLKLVRDRTPLFALSWAVMHEIDENSPLCGVENIEENLAMITATLVGHDETYSATVHARHIYFPEMIRADHRFIDVVSTNPDGQLVIDFTHFHDVESEADRTENEDAGKAEREEAPAKTEE